MCFGVTVAAVSVVRVSSVWQVLHHAEVPRDAQRPTRRSIVHSRGPSSQHPVTGPLPTDAKSTPTHSNRGPSNSAQPSTSLTDGSVVSEG